MQRGLFVVVLLVASLDSWCQYYSVYGHYYLNPFLYNPAEAATTRAALSANHRQQWLGFTGAPRITTVTFTSLIDNSRTGIGLKASTYSRGPLNTTDFNFSYAYAVPLGPKNLVYFGLSGGAVSNTVDGSNVDMSDPAVLRQIENNFQPVASFGILYRSTSGLNFGLILPQLIMPSYHPELQNFQNTSPSITDEIIASVYYKKQVARPLKKRGRKPSTDEVFAPLEFYGLYKYSSWGGDQFEMTAKLNCSNAMWIAGGYRQNYGVLTGLGFRLSEKMTLGYSYELGVNMQEGYSPDSHEISLILKTGAAKKLRRQSPTLQSTFKGPHSGEHVARFQEHGESIDPDASQKHYYVIVKSFKDFDLADQYKKKLINQKFNAEVYFHARQDLYYVFVFQSSKASDAHKESRNLRTYTRLKEARVLVVEKTNN